MRRYITHAKRSSCCSAIFLTSLARYLWPPNSPGLNPVDFKVWGRMQQLVYDKETLVTNVDELKQRLIEVWAGLQQKVYSAVDEWQMWQRVVQRDDILNTCCGLREW